MLWALWERRIYMGNTQKACVLSFSECLTDRWFDNQVQLQAVHIKTAPTLVLK